MSPLKIEKKSFSVETMVKSAIFSEILRGHGKNPGVSMFKKDNIFNQEG